MKNHQSHFIRLIGLASFLEQQKNLDQSLSTLVEQTAGIIKSDTCSIMLFKEEEAPGNFSLRISAQHGKLRPGASREAVKLQTGIAGHVAVTGKPLMVENIEASPFSRNARRPEDPDKGFICVPIVISDKVIGVLNISNPKDGRLFTVEDLNLAVFIAILTGKSIQLIQLQNLLRSRYIQLAIAREADSTWQGGLAAVSHDPAKISKILAKSFYKEMAAAGFGSDHIITAATEIISQLNQNLDKHKSHLERKS
jgi:GAF domain-containing protein